MALPLLAPLSAAMMPVTAGVSAPGSAVGTVAGSPGTQYAIKEAAPHIKGKGGKPIDPWTTGFMAGLGETAIGGADPLFATTKNIEMFGGPGLGFGASGEGTKATVERYVPGARAVSPYIQKAIGQDQALKPPSPSTATGVAPLSFEPGMLLGDTSVATPPPTTPTFGMGFSPVPPPPDLDFGRTDPLPRRVSPPPAVFDPRLERLRSFDPASAFPHESVPADPLFEEDIEVDYFGNPIDRRWRR